MQQAHRVPPQRGHGGRSRLHPRPEAAQEPPVQLLRLRLGRHAADPPLYAGCDLVIAAFTIDSDIPILNYLYLYSYNLYFSIIVYKLASKVMQQYQQSQRYPLYLKTTKAGFILYSALVTTALVYRIIKRDIACDCSFVVS